MVSDADREDIWHDTHGPCERCGDPVCLAQAAGSHEDDCICHGTVSGGIIVEDLAYCGQVCADAHAAPEPVVDAPTQPVDLCHGPYERAMLKAFWELAK